MSDAEAAQKVERPWNKFKVYEKDSEESKEIGMTQATFEMGGAETKVEIEKGPDGKDLLVLYLRRKEA